MIRCHMAELVLPGIATKTHPAGRPQPQPFHPPKNSPSCCHTPSKPPTPSLSNPPPTTPSHPPSKTLPVSTTQPDNSPHLAVQPAEKALPAHPTTYPQRIPAGSPAYPPTPWTLTTHCHGGPGEERLIVILGVGGVERGGGWSERFILSMWWLVW